MILFIFSFLSFIANQTRVQIAEVNSWNIICSLPRPKTFAIKFSPKGTYLAMLEHYSTPKDDSPPQPNFCVYQTNTGDVVYSIINKNFPDDWMPGWSNDESLFGIYSFFFFLPRNILFCFNFRVF